MTTSELIKQLSISLNISQKDAKQLVFQELNILNDILGQDNQVIIKGFGSFGLRKSRKSSTPGNVFFRPSKNLKSFIKNWRPE
ncbi:MAG: HU family DNA-binding protein [Gammaproteobacteria bacterium]|nr:HU family DNA-binding protein [Gammaproteobacteria bacterium]